MQHVALGDKRRGKQSACDLRVAWTQLDPARPEAKTPCQHSNESKSRPTIHKARRWVLFQALPGKLQLRKRPAHIHADKCPGLRVPGQGGAAIPYSNSFVK